MFSKVVPELANSLRLGVLFHGELVHRGSFTNTKLLKFGSACAVGVASIDARVGREWDMVPNGGATCNQA